MANSLARLTIIMGVLLVFTQFISFANTNEETSSDIAKEFVKEFKSLFEFKPNVFRGIKWGMSIRECVGMVLIESENRTKLYRRKTDSLVIEDINLTEKSYMFFDDQLMAIIIKTKGEEEFKVLKGIAFEEFEGWIQPDESIPDWLCLDIFAKTIRELEYQGSSQKGILQLISIEIYNEFKEVNKSIQKPEPKPEWSYVIGWEGNGAKTTEPFKINGAMWRIKWKNSGLVLQVFLYRTNGDLVSIPVNTSEKGEDVSYVYEKGEFYVTINAVGKWRIDIEQKGQE